MTGPEWAGTLPARGSQVLMHTYGRYRIELAAGRGTRLTDSEGREYLDFTSGIAVTALGHGHPAIVGALRRAAEGLIHVSNLYWTEPMIRLAERLTLATGMERAFFCNSGTEAVEAAVKLSRKHRRGRSRIVCFERSFHGRTMGSLSVTAQPGYQDQFRPLLPDVEVLPFGDREAAAEGIDEGVAMVLVEPLQGEGGVRPAPSGWLAHLRELCDASAVLLVFDEVQTGMGRTGSLFAFQREGVVPDALTVAKALAGGLPMGALLVRGEAVKGFEPGDHASTFGGGPAVAEAANAVLDVLLADGFLEEVKAKGDLLRSGLESLAASNDGVANVRGWGLLQGLVLGDASARRLVDLLQGAGLLTCPAGSDVVRFMPPLTVTADEIDEALGLVERSLPAL